MRPPTTTDLRHADPQTAPFRKPNNPMVLSLFLKPIIMLFILSFFLFVGIATLTFLLLLLAGSSLHLCRRRRTAAAFSLQDLQDYLPQFGYSGESAAKECAVCLESFKGGEPCRRLPDCGHVFHAICVDSWLSKVLNCPICRAHIRLCSSCGPASFQEDDDDFKMWWPVGASAD